jgi:pyrroline-5-carboxylate reductase
VENVKTRSVLITDSVGVLGVGHLGGALVAGLAAGEKAPRIVLSPRNAGRAKTLADRFGLAVARNNPELVERSQVIVVATRPADVLGAVRGLPWRDHHTAVSVAAGVLLPALQDAVRPATAVRALPITAAEIGESPTCLFPENLAARGVFERLGSVHVFGDEATFELASTHGVVYSVFHAVIGSTAAWFESSGVPEPEARRLAALAVRAAAGMVLSRPSVALDVMVDEFARPGSLTLAALRQLRKDGTLDALHAAWRAATWPAPERSRPRPPGATRPRAWTARRDSRKTRTARSAVAGCAE